MRYNNYNNRIENRMKELKEENKKAFVTYVTAGLPNLDVTKEIIRGQERAGTDVVELGIPFSDPIADGPVIQQASYEAILGGTILRKVFTMMEEIRAEGVEIPIIFMMYYNTIVNYGIRDFAVRCREAGVDGLIVPDLPLEEQGGLQEALDCANKGLSGALGTSDSNRPAACDSGIEGKSGGDGASVAGDNENADPACKSGANADGDGASVADGNGNDNPVCGARTNAGEVSYGAPDTILIQLVSPVSGKRIPEILAGARGFVYCVSAMGVTGQGGQFHREIRNYLEKVREYSSVPVLMGFGIRTPEDVEPVKEVIDGAIVGSHFINLLRDNDFDPNAAETYSREFKEAMNR